MHELSLARAILAEVVEAATVREVECVESIHLKIGALCGIFADSLELGFEIASVGTICEAASLQFSTSPVTIWCQSCDTAVSPIGQLDFRCPKCLTSSAQLITGRELEIVSFTPKPIALVSC